MHQIAQSTAQITERVSELQSITGNETVVYTAVTGKHDEITSIDFKNKDADYICITDDPLLKAEGWSIIPIEFKYRDPRRLAKIFKILPHLFLGPYNYSVWIDSNVLMQQDVTLLTEKYLKQEQNAIVFFPHGKRECAYREAQECLRWGKDSRILIKNQMRRYRDLGYPDHHGLIMGRFIMREHNLEQVRTLMEAWWKEIDSFSVRDQLSFNYCAWALVQPFCYIVNEQYDDFFYIRRHSKMVFYGTSKREKLRALLGSMFVTIGYMKRRLMTLYW